MVYVPFVFFTLKHGMKISFLPVLSTHASIAKDQGIPFEPEVWILTIEIFKELKFDTWNFSWRAKGS